MRRRVIGLSGLAAAAVMSVAACGRHEVVDEPPGVSVTPLRRLTASQYYHSLRDLLGDPGITVPDIERDLPDTTGIVRVAPAQALAVQRFATNAEQRVATLVGDPSAQTPSPMLAKLLPCDPMAIGEDACAGQFIERFGRRVYRRPLDATEKDELRALYTQARGAGDGFAGGIGIVLQGMLQSPAFLYHDELGDPRAPRKVGSLVPLTDYQIASRLAFFLWDSTPDEALLDIAERGALSTPGAVEAQARRMLKDPRARASVAVFHDRWLGLDKVRNSIKDGRFGLDASLRAAMIRETEEFAAAVILDGDAKMETLFTAPWSMVNQSVAERIYHVDGVIGGAFLRLDFGAATAAAGPRAGLLSQPSVLAATAGSEEGSPVFRGKLVRVQMLCQDLPPPPPNVPPPPPVTASASARDRSNEHLQNAGCSGCHTQMDPIGFAFSAYDAVGEHLDSEAGNPVDESGTLLTTGDKRLDGAIVGVPALARKLASSDVARRCMARQWFRFAFNRLEQGADDESIGDAYDAFAVGDYDIRELLVGITLTDAFRYHLVSEGEVSP